MAVATRTLKDTVVNASGAGGTVTVLVNWDDENSSNNNVLDMVLMVMQMEQNYTLKNCGGK